MNNLKHMYFDWLYDIVSHWDGIRDQSYRKLLYYLYSVDFEYSIPMDANRYDDGIELRYKFAYQNDIDQRLIAVELDTRPCSVLEMMIALAIRCEKDIMDSPSDEDRTDAWFWYMIKSLGLFDQDDELYSRDIISRKITKLLDRTYAPNGKGGLFTIPNCSDDLREIEIWTQAMWWLNYILKGE